VTVSTNDRTSIVFVLYPGYLVIIYFLLVLLFLALRRLLFAQIKFLTTWLQHQGLGNRGPLNDNTKSNRKNPSQHSVVQSNLFSVDILFTTGLVTSLMSK